MVRLSRVVGALYQLHYRQRPFDQTSSFSRQGAARVHYALQHRQSADWGADSHHRHFSRLRGAAPHPADFPSGAGDRTGVLFRIGVIVRHHEHLLSRHCAAGEHWRHGAHVGLAHVLHFGTSAKRAALCRDAAVS